MATYTHGVTYSDVLGECLFDTVNITASTTPVSTTLITTYIEQEADRINAILEEKGIDPASIASYESSQGLVANLLIEGAALKTNQRHGIPRLALQDLRERYDKHLAGLGSLRGANLGAAEPRKPGQRVDADPDNPRGLLISRKG